MGKYQGYEKYKDSGVEWLGEIPEHWDVWKVTHGFKNVGSGTTPKSDNSTFYDGGIPWITTSELRETLIEDTTQKVTQEALKDYSALKVYPKGSIAIAMYGATIGRLGILGIDATVNQACCVFSESEIFHLPFFYYYLWMHRPNLIALSAGGGQPNLSQDDLKQLRLPTPTLKEQEAIARFLDHKTKQIDDLIAKKEALIEKLDEKRTALISHAVTKGLDPNVPMKDSGVEWLGEIPEHWKKSVFRYYFDIQLGKMLQNEPQSESDEEVSYLKAIHVRWDKVDIYDLPKMWASPREKNKYHVRNGDLLISEGGEVGRTALLKELQEDCIIQNALHRVRPLSQSSVEYLNYLMRQISDTGWFDILCNKSTIAHLTSEKLGALALPLPPLDEQKTIAQYLDKKTAEIDLQKAKIQEAIERLKEYRTALITNAVTGKIDVRQVPIP
jgi:type I restriction enzyme S subunit